MRNNSLFRYLWLLPFISFIAGYWFMSIWYRPKAIVAPALVGKTIHEAMRTAADLNINLRLLEEREELTMPEGTILQQNPGAQASIRPQQSIFCIISKKPTRTVPKIVGKQWADCIKTLDELGIAYKQYAIESNCPDGLCIAQEPVPGSQLPQVPLIVYTAKSVIKPVIVPSFLYSTVPVAARFLETAPATMEIIHATQQPPDHQCDQQCIITDQRPKAGTLVMLDAQKPLHIQLFVG